MCHIAGRFLSKFRTRSLLGGGSPYLAEPNGLVIRNHRILVSDGAKACVHEFEENGKYVGKLGISACLKYPAGTHHLYIVN